MTPIYLFPGQGSQKLGMGAELFDSFPEQVAQADAELGYSVAELCVSDPHQQLNHTEFTQPALFVVNALTFLHHLLRTGKLPQFVAGHSLGEYNALFAAGVFDFPTGVRLVKQRAKLMGQASGGGMAAVIGLPASVIAETLIAAGLSTIDLANLNSPNQVVISGPSDDLTRAEAVLLGAGAQLFKRLAVSAAFHSRYMAEAEKSFRSFLERFSFAPPRVPVIANVTAEAYDAARLQETLATQITRPVRWLDSVRRLLEEPSPEFLELGPGNVLTGLLRRIKADFAPRPS